MIKRVRLLLSLVFFLLQLSLKSWLRLMGWLRVFMVGGFVIFYGSFLVVGFGFLVVLYDFEMLGNMSDDMKEIINCVCQVMCFGLLERKVKSIFSQMVGLVSVGIQIICMVSVGLQIDLFCSSFYGKVWLFCSFLFVFVCSKQIFFFFG